jgi:hypothetical protein
MAAGVGFSSAARIPSALFYLGDRRVSKFTVPKGNKACTVTYHKESEEFTVHVMSDLAHLGDTLEWLVGKKNNVLFIGLIQERVPRAEEGSDDS